MKSLIQPAVWALVGSCYASPLARQIEKRQVESQMNDVDILRYALTLEHLEDKFYREGLANFSQSAFAAAGYDSTFYQNVQTISTHETGHVAFLTAALNAAGSAPTEECTYAFGITSVAQFVATASVLEGVGTSAYLGAAAQIATKVYLTAAGSILTIEARHSSYLRASLAESPFPQAYDDPLTPDEVHTLAHGFIVSCPADNPTFPVKAFPGLTVTTTGTITSGMTIGVQTAGYALAAADANAHIYAAFVTVTGPDWALLQPAGDGKSYQVTVPQGVNGQSYLLFTNCNETVNDNTVVAGPTIVEITNPPVSAASSNTTSS
ncbi:hypothetical protein LTR91_018146 [Friedmanniomyces endolithicus]|uniref:Protein rds1 n=1 Tax=Friedmanniomyces endolithicus TaxID=329885 RepID=A0AAN6HFF4_9PEZI|nr:hypothetical protein LTR94_017199 [Friedmanniomyces endolithicus]KAK0769665.1 hypothetical protein LTR59_016897 [Friedmanniomyces endolithicus]KAK0776371.1 hypothetical protein LTR38_015523 [Friedmanniomyces endolithicus]KAK0833448.1 hypothetical protein LTR03_014754 [Friedmanniomyces endolithicus]KAK0860176.1 hypothetical protein LTR87_017379 [Friedmanniomyces endolithicus]